MMDAMLAGEALAQPDQGSGRLAVRRGCLAPRNGLRIPDCTGERRGAQATPHELVHVAGRPPHVVRTPRGTAPPIATLAACGLDLAAVFDAARAAARPA
ncbi:MAG: hypothetical protein NZ523_06495 [Elioraea sp.]|nr:hypothetical protein [Elioraea sp.]